MSYNGRLVIDTDCHIQEYWDMDRTYKEFIDPKYREDYERFSEAVRADQRRVAETGFGLGAGTSIWMGAVHQHPQFRPMGMHQPFEKQLSVRPAGNGDPADVASWDADHHGEALRTVFGRRKVDIAVNWDTGLYLADMDKAGVDVGVMFASQSDNYAMLRDVGFEHALHEAYHEYVHRFCAEAGGRLRWLTNAVIRDASASVADLTYWAERDDNYAGAFVPRIFPDGRLLDNPDLFPLWERSQELDLPIWVHGNPDHAPLTPGSRITDNVDMRGVHRAWAGMTALGALIGGGIFDLFPRLRVTLMENESDWMPWFIEACDNSFRPGSPSTPNLKRKPSDIMAGGQIFCGIDPDEPMLRQSVELLGEHPWLFTTDYPHLSGPWPEGVPQLVERTDLAESAKVAMVYDNAIRLLPRLANVPTLLAKS